MADPNTFRSTTAALFARDGGLNPPPEVLIAWPAPNYVNPESRGWAAPVFIIIIGVISFLVFFARMWARLVVAKNAGWDDFLIAIAMLPLLGLTISTVLALKVYGFQWHTWDQTAKTLVTTREIMMSIEVNYLISTTLIKVSILMFYRRMTGSLTHTFVYWVWGSIIFTIIYCIVFTLCIVFTCSPIVGYFHLFDLPWRFTHELYCHNEGAVVVACAAISTVQDLVICMLPVLLIWNLQILKRQKIALCCIFGLGLITCVCGIMRTYYATYDYYYTYDITWNAYHGWVWTCLESQLAVICASAPARFKVFFQRYFASVASHVGYTGSSSRKTPMHSIRSRGYGKMSHGQSVNSTRSHTITGGTQHAGVPLGGITVCQDLEIQVEDRDDISQKSFESTKNLTALPSSDPPEVKGKDGWVEGCRTVCSALSRDTSRSRNDERDLERGSP